MESNWLWPCCPCNPTQPHAHKRKCSNLGFTFLHMFYMHTQERCQHSWIYGQFLIHSNNQHTTINLQRHLRDAGGIHGTQIHPLFFSHRTWILSLAQNRLHGEQHSGLHRKCTSISLQHTKQHCSQDRMRGLLSIETCCLGMICYLMLIILIEQGKSCCVIKHPSYVDHHLGVICPKVILPPAQVFMSFTREAFQILQVDFFY